MWFLVALIWLALVVGIFWAYARKRRLAGSERAKELSALIAEAQSVARPAADMAAVATAVAAPAPVAAPIINVMRRPRVLGQADALLYLLFRAGLPDHEIFTNLTLADVIEPATELRGYEREQSVRKYAQHRLNIVVCSKQFEVVAVVLPELNAPAAGATADSYVQSCLNAADILLLRVNPSALPRHHQVRALIYGDNAPGGA